MSIIKIIKKLFNKIRSIPKLIYYDGIDAAYFRVLKNFGIKKNYYSIIEKKKYQLEQKIIDLTDRKVIDGIYEGVLLDCKTNRGTYDFATKLLGIYEEQVQKIIQKLQVENDLNYIINFGTADGYHLIGLLKNKIFDYGFSFEIDEKMNNHLLENIKLNNLEEKIKLYNNKADLNFIDGILKKDELKKTLFLVDIEGDEFNLFNDTNIEKYKNSYFVIEDHNFYIRDKDKKDYFYELINKHFKVQLINTGSRNPYNYKILDNFNDDEKWLVMSEGRPMTMNWLLLSPI